MGDDAPVVAVAPALPDQRTAAEAVQVWASADPQLANILASGVPLADAASRWGLHLFRRDRLADAVAVFRAAAALLPDDPDSWTRLGIALDRSHRPAEAAGALERSVALRREQPDTWILLGQVRGKLGDRSGAEAAYRTVLDQRPSCCAAWQCLALLMEEGRDYAAAIDAFRACVSLGEGSVAIWANLGRLCYQTARVLEAHDAYEVAMRGDPSNALYRQMFRKARFARDVLEGASVDVALEAYEREEPPLGDEARKRRLDLLEASAGLLATSGHLDGALRLVSKRLQLEPSSASARYLLNVLVDEPGLERSPTDYIVESFDAFAEQFDAKLVGVLGYDVPEQLCAIVRSAAAPGRRYDALDAGCGTGLCGPLLRPLSRDLVGVDLSAKMLEQAARRGDYDTLVREELTAFLARNPGRFDLIVAADVLIYFGDLAPLFAVAATAIRAGGLLAVSTEQLGARSDPGRGYRVLPSGRFAHAPEYVRAAADPGFGQELVTSTTLRLNADERVPGNLFLFRAAPEHGAP